MVSSKVALEERKEKEKEVVGIGVKKWLLLLPTWSSSVVVVIVGSRHRWFSSSLVLVIVGCRHRWLSSSLVVVIVGSRHRWLSLVILASIVILIVVVSCRAGWDSLEWVESGLVWGTEPRAMQRLSGGRSSRVG